MFLTHETDYAIRVLRSLADGELHIVSEICKEQEIPQHFCYKVVEKLQAAELVQCTKGRNGGCRLTADLHEASLYDVLIALGHKPYVNDCLKPDHKCPWMETHGGHCTVHKNLDKLQEELEEKFQNMKLYGVIFE